MTRKEALEKGRAIREEKLLFNLYQKNKGLINKDHPVTYEMWKKRIKKAWSDNPRYENVKSLVAAGKKMLHTTEYVSKEQIGIENIKEGLKQMKTGRRIAWGKPKLKDIRAGKFEYEQPTKEETMFDVFRRLSGVGKKFDIYWNEDTMTYRFVGQNGLEYEIIADTSPIRYGIQLVNA